MAHEAGHFLGALNEKGKYDSEYGQPEKTSQNVPEVADERPRTFMFKLKPEVSDLLEACSLLARNAKNDFKTINVRVKTVDPVPSDREATLADAGR